MCAVCVCARVCVSVCVCICARVYCMCLSVCTCSVCACTHCYIHVCGRVYQFHLTFSHPPADKVTNDIKIPLYPARDVPYELLIKAFVGQKTRYLHVKALILHNSIITTIM